MRLRQTGAPGGSPMKPLTGVRIVAVYSFLWAVALLGLFTVGRGESFFSPLMLVLIPLSFMIGRGLLKLQQWARRGALVLSVLCILSSLPLPCYVCYEIGRASCR